MSVELGAVARGPGRPTLSSPQMHEHICDEIATGKSVAEICRVAGMPDLSTIWRWLEKDPVFAAKYARAREIQAEVMDDLILTEAAATTPENASAARVKIDAYKWRAAKLAPKRFGDRVALTGADGGAVQLEHHHEVVDIRTMDPDARALLREALDAAAASEARDVTPGEG